MAKMKAYYAELIDRMVDENTDLEPIEGCECGCNEEN